MQLVGIVDQGIKELRNKTILMVKVLWWSDTIEDTTWETEAFMKNIILTSSIPSKYKF